MSFFSLYTLLSGTFVSVTGMLYAGSGKVKNQGKVRLPIKPALLLKD